MNIFISCAQCGSVTKCEYPSKDHIIVYPCEKCLKEHAESAMGMVLDKYNETVINLLDEKLKERDEKNGS